MLVGLQRPRVIAASSKALTFARWYSSTNEAFKILFLGRSEFSCLVLEELWKATDVWSRIHVATHPDEWKGRNRAQLSISPLKILATERDIPVSEIPHTKPAFKSWKPPHPFDPPTGSILPLDYVVITASFGRILPAALLRRFDASRRLNVHPSLLPLYRGPAPIQHVLMNGRSETGVCVIEMMERSKGIDAGPIWGSSKISIPHSADFTSLRDTLAIEGGKVLVSVLRDMLNNTAVATPQDVLSDVDPPRASAITFEDSLVDFDKMSAEVICWRYRAISAQRPLITFYGPGVKLQLHSPSILTPLAEFRTKIGDAPTGTAVFDAHFRGGGLLIRCAEGSLLHVPRVKQENKTLLLASEWWNGVKGLGLVVNEQIKFVPRI
ncbi:Formyltransferase [Pleurotus eryngii]|uniref:methionyl-tRNA formyltransferase n=1 Tax=Pleurotus eryngii TaxID=5323 RepID=A0A9P6A7J5_PLEER|nr:Formyltransferase [Pleurotus eryngii]